MVANKVEKLLVTNGTEAASVAAATAGQYVALVQGKDANTPLEVSDKFQLAVRKLNGEVQYTDVIKAKDIVSVQIQPYRAPVAQVSTITIDTPVVDTVYVLTIIDKADKEVLQRRQDKRTYAVTATAGETASTLAAKFRGVIGDDTSATVTVSGTADAVVLTAKTDPTDAAGIQGLQHYFEVFLYGQDALGNQAPFGTITDTADVDFGSGTYAHLKEIERFAQGYEGYLNRTKFPVELYPSDLTAGGTYDLVVIGYNNHYYSNSTVFGDRVSDPIEIVIAVDAGETADLEALLANYLPEPETGGGD